MRNWLCFVFWVALFAFGGCTKETSPAAIVLNRPPVTLAQIKAHSLAFSAILATGNRESSDQLVPPMNEREAKAAARLLADYWDVHDRTQLIDLLVGIENGTNGHRAAFHHKLESLSGVSSEKILPWVMADGEEEIERNIIVATYRRAPVPKTLYFTAWDYGRYINLCRWGYSAGFMTEDELWMRVIPVARMLQAAFGSWQEFSDDYVAGREYWSPASMRKNGDKTRKDVASLFFPGSGSGTMEDPEIPKGQWARTPWTQSLGDGPSAQDVYAASLRIPEKSPGSSTKAVPAKAKIQKPGT